MTPQEAAANIRRTAKAFAEGRATVRDMWFAFHEDLLDLCADEPLDDDFCGLFDALEEWEISAPQAAREDAVEKVRSVAAALST